MLEGGLDVDKGFCEFVRVCDVHPVHALRCYGSILALGQWT